jgi:hypothetical protein
VQLGTAIARALADGAGAALADGRLCATLEVGSGRSVVAVTSPVFARRQPHAHALAKSHTHLCRRTMCAVAVPNVSLAVARSPALSSPVDASSFHRVDRQTFVDRRGV